MTTMEHLGGGGGTREKKNHKRNQEVWLSGCLSDIDYKLPGPQRSLGQTVKFLCGSRQLHRNQGDSVHMGPQRTQIHSRLEESLSSSFYRCDLSLPFTTVTKNLKGWIIILGICRTRSGGRANEGPSSWSKVLPSGSLAPFALCLSTEEWGDLDPGSGFAADSTYFLEPSGLWLSAPLSQVPPFCLHNCRRIKERIMERWLSG